MENYENNIGKRCKKEKKPFKSGLLINTIKGVINHPHLNIPAYTFEEDDSYVECRRCNIVVEGLEQYDIAHNKIINSIVGDNVESELVEILSEYDNDDTNRGILRTILIAVKPIRDINDEVSIVYNRLADRLRSGSIHGII